MATATQSLTFGTWVNLGTAPRTVTCVSGAPAVIHVAASSPAAGALGHVIHPQDAVGKESSIEFGSSVSGNVYARSLSESARSLVVHT